MGRYDREPERGVQLQVIDVEEIAVVTRVYAGGRGWEEGGGRREGRKEGRKDENTKGEGKNKGY